MVFRVKDLEPEQRHAAEILLGHPIPDDGAVSIKSLDSPAPLPAPLASPQERIAALRALELRFAVMPTPEVSLAEEDELVREAFRQTRHGRRPSS